MGFLLDLIHRLLGPRTQPPAKPAAPAPRPRPRPAALRVAEPQSPALATASPPESEPIPPALEIFHPPLPPLAGPPLPSDAPRPEVLVAPAVADSDDLVAAVEPPPAQPAPTDPTAPAVDPDETLPSAPEPEPEITPGGGARITEIDPEPAATSLLAPPADEAAADPGTVGAEVEPTPAGDHEAQLVEDHPPVDPEPDAEAIPAPIAVELAPPPVAEPAAPVDEPPSAAPVAEDASAAIPTDSAPAPPVAPLAPARPAPMAGEPNRDDGAPALAVDAPAISAADVDLGLEPDPALSRGDAGSALRPGVTWLPVTVDPSAVAPPEPVDRATAAPASTGGDSLPAEVVGAEVPQSEPVGLAEPAGLVEPADGPGAPPDEGVAPESSEPPTGAAVESHGLAEPGATDPPGPEGATLAVAEQLETVPPATGSGATESAHRPEPEPQPAARPLGLAADPGAPLLGPWGGSSEAKPSLAAQLADLALDPRAPLTTPEAVAMRAATDRELVAEGFLTAEGLLAAQQSLAVPPPAVDRAARPAQRLAAAEARRARREAAAVARQTEIVYLGRGVSEALHDHRGDPSRLAALGLPPLDRPADLAEALGITVGRLRWLAFHAEVATRVHYVGFEIAKAGGGVRRLSAPHQGLAQAQRWVFETIVGRLPVEPEAHGFVPGRSILTNAQPHAGRAVVINLDLADFFPSIGHRAVRTVFERVGYSPAVATVLALLGTEAPRRTVAVAGVTHHVATGPRGLPQGACTSPGLANQVARRLDRRLRGLARHCGATYTRYADDLTFSGDGDLDRRVGALLAAVRRIAASEGFRVHEGKTRVQRPNTAQTVTGLVVNDRPGVPRAEARRLRALLHRAKTEGLDAQNRTDHPDFRASVLGRIAFVGMARPDLGARLLADYRALERPPTT